MSLGLIVDSVALAFAAVNIILLLSILSHITSIADAPRAWNFLTVGMGMVVIHFSIEVFIFVNPFFNFFGMHVISSTASMLGFGFLFWGIYNVWGVVYR